jgi:cytochrome c-type protein NapB
VRGSDPQTSGNGRSGFGHTIMNTSPSPSPSSAGFGRRSTVLFLISVIAFAVVGYFVGILDGVPQVDAAPVAESLLPEHAKAADSDRSTATIPAVSYGQMRRRVTGPTGNWQQSLQQIPQPQIDLFAEIKPNEAEKLVSTHIRASRRAFNGAPPVIPHAVENTSDAACYACHGQGMRIVDRVANQMSHGFLANCTQCHAPPPPAVFAAIEPHVENSFVGLPAPLAGERAFAGAPPTIPHSTWMRETCLACHGNEAGWAGLQSTHPWRSQCQQCHAPSAELNQAVTGQPGFLPPPETNDR